MRNHSISIAQVIKILQNIKLKGGFLPQPPPLRTPLHLCVSKRRAHFYCEIFQFVKSIFAD